MRKGIMDVVYSDVWGPAKLCHVHRRFLQAHLDLPDEKEERSVWTLPEVQSRSKKDYGSARTLPSIK